MPEQQVLLRHLIDVEVARTRRIECHPLQTRFMLWPLAVKYVPFAVPFTARTMLFSSAEEQIRTGTPALVASEAAESFVVMPPVPLPDPHRLPQQ